MDDEIERTSRRSASCRKTQISAGSSPVRCGGRVGWTTRLRNTRETIRLQPGMHYTHRGLGLALDQKERFDDAIVSHREAIRLQPNERAYHYALGALHARKGQWDQAATAFGEAVRLKPDDMASLYRYTTLCFFRKDLDSHCRTCRSWLDTASGTRISLADVTAKVCALRPDVVGEETCKADRDQAEWDRTTRLGSLVRHHPRPGRVSRRRFC